MWKRVYVHEPLRMNPGGNWIPESCRNRYLQDPHDSDPHDCTAITHTHGGIPPAFSSHVVKSINTLALDFPIFLKHISILGYEVFLLLLYPLLVSLLPLNFWSQLPSVLQGLVKIELDCYFSSNKLTGCSASFDGQATLPWKICDLW